MSHLGIFDISNLLKSRLRKSAYYPGLMSLLESFPRFARMILALLVMGLLLLSCREPARASEGETATITTNLIRSSRLVDGLPSGWALAGKNVPVMSEGDDVAAESDDSMVGPTGYPVFHLEVLKPEGVPGPYGWEDSVYLYSEPFQVPESGDYIASFYLKGEASGDVEVVGSRLAAQGRQPFVVTDADGWKRIYCRFKGTAREPFYAMRLEIRGQVWLDGFQVSMGRELLPYASGQPAEIALSVVEGELPGTRMQFADEPALVRWTVTGASVGDHLMGSVIDLNGTRWPLPDVILSGEPLQSGEWNFMDGSGIHYGQFRVEAVVGGEQGKVKSADYEVVVTRLRRPRYWGQDAPDSYFGTHIEPISRQIAMAKAMGMNWVRLHDAGIQLLGWFYLEEKPGQWRFYDEQIDRFRDGKLMIFGELGTAPHFRSRASLSTAEPLSIQQTKTTAFFAPLKTEEYADYVNRAVGHYGDKIQVYDIWNEPWHPSFFSIDFLRSQPASKERASDLGGGWYINSSEAPQSYVALQEAAYDVIKSNYPNVTVVGMNTHTHEGKDGRFSGEEWTEGTLEAGVLETLDVIGYHQYAYKTDVGHDGDALDEELDEVAFGPAGGLKGIQAEGHPVWMTEGSPVARKTYSGFYNHTLPYEHEDESWDTSERMVRYMVKLLSRDIQKMFLYSMDAYVYFGQKSRARVFVTEEGYPHPTGVAASTTAWHLDGKRFREAIPLADKSGTAYVFESDEEIVGVLMPRRGSHLAVPQVAGDGITVEDIFGNQPNEDSTETTLFVSGAPEIMTPFLEQLPREAGASELVLNETDSSQ